MSKKQMQECDGETVIEVIAKKGDKIYIFDIKKKDFKSMTKLKGFTYQPYQLGFSKFKGAIRKDYYKEIKTKS